MSSSCDIRLGGRSTTSTRPATSDNAGSRIDSVRTPGTIRPLSVPRPAPRQRSIRDHQALSTGGAAATDTGSPAPGGVDRLVAVGERRDDATEGAVAVEHGRGAGGGAVGLDAGGGDEPYALVRGG